MSTLVLSDKTLADLAVQSIVVATAQGEDGLVLLPGSESLNEQLDGKLADALKVLGGTGAEDELVKLATLGQASVPLVIAVGLGSVQDSAYADDSVRRAAGIAARAIAGQAHTAVTIAGVNGEDDAELAGAVAEGLLLGGYTFTKYKSKPQPDDQMPVKKVSILVGKARDGQLRKALTKAIATAAAVNLTRDFINTPALDLYPDSFAKEAKSLADKAGLKVEVLDEKKLKSGGYGGVLAVGSGSSRQPRLVRITYTPAAKTKDTATVALVGKGITFDSGGISIKPAAKMDEMKTDMSGAAAVIASVLLAAELKLPLVVTATVPMAENMPSGTAYRPSDVLTFRNGKTAEILNTDAEGRVVLADAIARACEDSPDYLIETSTLTGAQGVALGWRTSGVMGSEDFRDRVAEAGNCVGEAMWAMPLPAEVRKSMDSPVADFANIGDGKGGMLAGGHFLAEFVTEGVEWAHIDIASPAHTSTAYGYNPKGAVGVPVRTILHVLEDIAANG